jgi:hypothetical protein
MKMIFVRNSNVDYYDYRLNETYPKYYRKGDSLDVTFVERDGNYLIVSLESGDGLSDVPETSLVEAADY